jgi:RHS repeat-associated protein
VYGSDQNIALVLDENGNVNHRYLFGNGVDQIEADESNGNVLWALTDHLGSVRDVVDDSGTVLNHVVYDAFGGVTSQTDESVVFRYGYTARELDAESGLQYNRARYLDSFTGKFISEDPIGFQAGDSNLYRYVFNSPTNFIDPSGNYAILVPIAVAGFLIGQATSALISEPNYIEIPQINGYYFRATGILILEDRSRNGKSITVSGLFSGNGEFQNKPQFQSLKDNGPIPQGTYEIFDDKDPRNVGWYRLDRIDSNPRNDRDDDLTGRDGFRLHPGRRSDGCITIPKSETTKWDKVKELIEGTQKRERIDRKGNIWMLRQTQLTKYGQINVY